MFKSVCVINKEYLTLGQYVPLHHPDGAAGGTVPIVKMKEIPVEARRPVPEGLLTLSKQVHWIKGTHRGPPLLLQDTQTDRHTDREDADGLFLFRDEMQHKTAA